METGFRILGGLLLLVFGRRLFWLFVGIVGFIVGYFLVPHYLPHLAEQSRLVIGVAAGTGCAVLAVFMQKFGIALAGFLAGGYLVASLMHGLGGGEGSFPWLFFILGGVAGAILLSLVFGWALILLSSLTGALLVVQGLGLSYQKGFIALVLLFVIGVLIQAKMMGGKGHQESPQ